MSNDLTPTQRMNDVLQRKHIQKKVLADAIGVPPTTLQSWINRGVDFPASYTIPIADVLGVHPLWLLSGADVLPPKIPDGFVELKEDEYFLLETYRNLDREGRVVVSNKAVEEMRRLKAELGNAPIARDGAASNA